MADGLRNFGAAGWRRCDAAWKAASSFRTRVLGESTRGRALSWSALDVLLVAYNLDLETEDVSIARAVAAAVRESSGGMPGVQAIGLRLPASGRVQVSMNVVDLERAPLHVVVERVRAEAKTRGVTVSRGELVGLVPERALLAAQAAGVELPGIDEAHVLERALGSRGLSGKSGAHSSARTERA